MGKQTTAGLGKVAMPLVPEAKTLDDCVRHVTAFQNFDDLKATDSSYAPTIYVRGMSAAERQSARRVVDAFNAWAGRDGNRARLAEVRA